MTAATPVLNLNNEVVKMRKDVKNVKALTIRKLIRHIAKLKSKKGTEELVLKNQRRAQRLLEEIQSIRKLKPDDVTKTALGKEMSFDAVFNKANSTAEARALARLATHSLIKRKISAIKDAIKAFKEARMKEAEEEANPTEPSLPKEATINQAKQETKSEQPSLPKEATINQAKQEAKPEQPSLPNEAKMNQTEQDAKSKLASSPSKPAKSIKKAESKPKLVKAKQKRKTKETKLENVIDKPLVEMEEKESDLAASNHSTEEPCSATTPQAQCVRDVPEALTEKNILQSSLKRDTVQNKPEEKIEQSFPDQKVPSTNESESSDLEDSDQEVKEYFDDSTEERFLKQSSGFEDSDGDSEDDFFVGKVRRTRKKKSSKNDHQVKRDKLPPGNTKLSISSTEEQKASTGPKNVKLESVFCTSLAETKQKSPYMRRESKLPPVRNKKPVFPQANTFSRRPQPVKASAVKQQSKVQEQTLHPSWEASRKRKAQSQIATFQGKKIVFDD